MPPLGDRYDIIILGSGITGLSTVYHLRKAGVQSIALASATDRAQIATSSTPGLLFGTPLDNFTRPSHRHGTDVARDIWQFSSSAFEGVISYCDAHKIPHAKGQRQRFITSDHEVSEAIIATQQLQNIGRPVQMRTPPIECSSTVRAVQDEGLLGAVVEVPDLLAALESHPYAAMLPKIDRIAADGRGPIALFTADGRQFTCEIVVLACHLDISRLLPELSEAIVTTAQQWCQIDFDHAVPPAFHNLIFSWNHGNVWGGFNTPQSARIGGASYLRPNGGMEAEVASVDPQISDHLMEQLTRNFAFLKSPRIMKTTAGLDIRPCDELPIIGPMFGNGRVLVACGYMGHGLSWGFHAGKCLAELMVTGRAMDLPRSFWPERLRSLE
ncbi:MAG: FAD-binding oxidoreductase [Deltaproteobacteria bacterium]|nr:FAD-binding oxidoreductase [Deltaproteobacteria bacterium]